MANERVTRSGTKAKEATVDRPKAVAAVADPSKAVAARKKKTPAFSYYNPSNPQAVRHCMALIAAHSSSLNGIKATFTGVAHLFVGQDTRTDGATKTAFCRQAKDATALPKAIDCVREGLKAKTVPISDVPTIVITFLLANGFSLAGVDGLDTVATVTAGNAGTGGMGGGIASLTLGKDRAGGHDAAAPGPSLAATAGGSLKPGTPGRGRLVVQPPNTSSGDVAHADYFPFSTPGGDAAPTSVLASAAPGDTYSFEMIFFDGHKAEVFVEAGRYWCDAPGQGSIELRVLTDADDSLQYLCHGKKIVGMVPQDVIGTEAPVARGAAANGGGFGNLKDDRHPFYACDDSPDGSRKNPTPRQLHLNKPHMIEPTPPPLASGSLAGRPPGTSDATEPPSAVARSNPSTHSAMVAILQGQEGILQGQEGINRRQEEFNGEQRRHNDMMDNWWKQQGQQWVQQGQHNANVNEKLVNFSQTQREQGERLDDIEASNRERDVNTDAQRSEFEARLGKLEDQGGGLSDQAAAVAAGIGAPSPSLTGLAADAPPSFGAGADLFSVAKTSSDCAGPAGIIEFGRKFSDTPSLPEFLLKKFLEKKCAPLPEGCLEPLTLYTEDYFDVNKTIRGFGMAGLTESQAIMVRLISTGLLALPIFTSETYFVHRAIQARSLEDVLVFKDLMEEGKAFVEPAFLSTTLLGVDDRGPVEYFFGRMNTWIAVLSKSGRYIVQELCEVPEYEVLFDLGTSFRILSFEDTMPDEEHDTSPSQAGRYRIVMEEI